MNSIFRNKEFRLVIIKLLIVQLILAGIGFLVVNLFMNKINNNILERDMAMVGSIIEKHPELEKEIVPLISKGGSKKDRLLGQDLLEEYGYQRQMDKTYQKVLENINPNIQLSIFLLIILFTLPLVWVIYREYRKIYKKVNEISTAAEGVVEGDFSIYLQEEGEGDFNILSHQFNQMAERLENTLDNLEKDKILLKNIISDISHQLKTPLSSLIILNDILINDKNIDEERKIEFLNKMKSQIDRMEWLIINLLKVARIEAGAIEFKKERVLFRDIVDKVLEGLHLQLKNQEVYIKGDQTASFKGDRNWTVEALINIVKNSIEHGRGKIEINLEEGPLFSSIRIRDNGEGIEDKDLPYIFERFYKVSTEVKPESVGIGLNLAKLIIESQEGSISVKSRKDEGTEFIITFLN